MYRGDRQTSRRCRKSEVAKKTGIHGFGVLDKAARQSCLAIPIACIRRNGVEQASGPPYIDCAVVGRKRRFVQLGPNSARAVAGANMVSRC